MYSLGLISIVGDIYYEWDGTKWVEPSWSKARRWAEAREREALIANKRERERARKERQATPAGTPVEINLGFASWTPTMSVILELEDTDEPSYLMERMKRERRRE